MRFTLVILLLFFGSAAAAPADPWQQRWSEHLSRDVLPHWVAESTREAALPDDPRSRHFLPQLRLLYVVSVGIARETDPAAREALRARLAQKLDALVERFQDADTGDWHALARELRPTGAPGGFSSQDQAWAVYLLAEIHALTGDPRPLQLARATFARIDLLAHDERHGGYYLDYTPSTPSAERDHEAARKNSALHLHLLIALARLQRALPGDELVRLRLGEVRACIPRFIDSDSGQARWALGRDWYPADFKAPADNQTLYGQNAEIITYLLDVAALTGESPESLRPLLASLAGGLLRDGVSPNGAVYFRGPMKGPATDHRVWWWPQAETAAAFWKLHVLTGDAAYLDAFHRVSAWTFAHTIPLRSSAFWLTLTDAEGRPLSHGEAGHELQTGFHAIRSILLIEKSAR